MENAAIIANSEPQTLVTFREYSECWLEERVAEGLRCKRGYRSILDAYLLHAFGGRPLSQITRAEYRAFVLRLRSSTGVRGERLAPRSLRNICALFRVLMLDAVEDELIPSAPIARHRRLLPKQVDHDPSWRPKAVFSLGEVGRLCAEPEDERDRMLCTIAFTTGARVSEIGALMWNAWEPDTGDGLLGSLTIAWAYSTTDRVRRIPKTGVGSLRPVHPALARMLERWYLDGWARTYGRKPGPADLILPSCFRRGELWPFRNDNKRFRRLLGSLGMRHRGLHCARATFISLLQGAGVDEPIIEWMTHPKPSYGPGAAFGGYRRSPFSWRILCDAVLSLRLEVLDVERVP